MLEYKRYLAIIIIATMFLGGCWNYAPLKERSIVVAVGLDKRVDGKIELSLQIANPALIKPDQIVQENAVTVVSDNGDTVFEAVRGMLKKVNRKPYYGHLQLIVIGEELAKDNIKEILDFFERDHEPRLIPYVVVAKGLKAKEILSATSNLSYIPAIHIKNTIENAKGSGKIKRKTLIEILKEINYPEYNPLLGVIQREGRKQVKKISDLKIEGTGVFRYTKLIGYLDGKETRALTFLKDEMKSGIIKIKNPLHKDKFVSIEIISSKSKIEAELKENEPSFAINIKTKVSLGGQQGKGDLTTEKMIEKLEDETKATIKKDVSEMIQKVQKVYESDVLGFAEVISKKYPEYWSKNKDKWNRTFPNVSVNVNVDVEMKRFGLINKTTEEQ